METKKSDEVPKKKRKWRKSMMLRKGWAILCLFVLFSLLISMTFRGY